jgi:hypothetical protein
MIELLLIALATAGIVHTVHTSILFEGFRLLIDRHEPKAPWLVRGFKCSYCFAHWIAGGLALVAASSVGHWLLLTFAGMWLANHSLAIYGMLINVADLKRGEWQRVNEAQRRVA